MKKNILAATSLWSFLLNKFLVKNGVKIVSIFHIWFQLFCWTQQLFKQKIPQVISSGNIVSKNFATNFSFF